MRKQLLRNLHGYGKRQYFKGYQKARNLARVENNEMLKDLEIEIRTQIDEETKEAFGRGKEVSKNYYQNGRTYFCKGCGRDNVFYPISGRKSWSCKNCGNHISPTVGTIFEKSTVSQEKWNRAIGMVKANKFVLAREVAQACKVTYKTGWRMRKLLREEFYPDYISKGRGNFEPKK